MLVHPSRETPGHGQFFHWITQIRQQWLDLFGTQADEHERAQFVEGFRPAHDDLHRTVPDLPAFDELARELHYAIRKTEVFEVNARPTTPQPDWRITYPWILVGGQAMDRGFTVEGLTVTYMPRDMGVGNADTIQQRARFVGYKRPYLGFGRVFSEQGLLQAFQFYVAHERDIRQRLIEHRGRPLSEWRRAFFLDSNFRPTRRQVLVLHYRQDVLSNDWFWPKVPHGSQELLDENRQTVQRFSGSLTWRQDDGDPRRTADQIHLIAERVPLRRAYEDLLSPLRFTGERDSQLFTGAMLQMVPDGRRPTNRALPPVRAGGWRQRCLPRAPVVIPVAVPPSSDIWRGLSPPWRAPWTTRSRPRQANEPAASARARRAMPPRDASVHPVTEQYSDSSRPT